jgi:NAD(P)-dependent dehydrogenase (short-subunit alcohol dehydrogenase family)
LVTGGAFGLGAAICQHAARAGYRVAVLEGTGNSSTPVHSVAEL